MKLYEDQIHSPAFQKISDYIWSPNLDDVYVQSVIREHNPNLVPCNKHSPPKDGIIFVGMTQLIEDVLTQVPKEGTFIIIHRPSDRSFTEAHYQLKPPSVKHIYTVDCAVNKDDVTAIPFGNASIDGNDNIIGTIDHVVPAKTRVFVRYNVNNSGYTQERIDSIPILQSKPFCKVITEQIPADEFYREIKSHQFTMSLKGCGMDGARTYSAMTLGSIPIVTESIEMRHFMDMPMAYCPPWKDFTEEWLDQQVELMKDKSTERMRMSYWRDQIKLMRSQWI